MAGMDGLPFSGNNTDTRDIELNEYDKFLVKERRAHRALTESSDHIIMKTTTLQSELCCPICLDLFTNTMTTKECLHRFCADCITTALLRGNKECPTCRKKLVSKRSLRPDPNMDAIIEKIWPDRKLYEIMQSKSMDEFSSNPSLHASIEEGIKAQAANRRQKVAGSFENAQQPGLRRKRNANGELVEVTDDDNRSTPPEYEEIGSPLLDDTATTITDSHNSDDASPPIEQLLMQIRSQSPISQNPLSDMPTLYSSTPQESITPPEDRPETFLLPVPPGFQPVTNYPDMNNLGWGAFDAPTNGECNENGNGNGMTNGNGTGPGSQGSNSSSEDEEDIDQILEDWEMLAREENYDDIPDAALARDEGDSESDDSESSSDDSSDSSDSSSDDDGITISDVSDDTIPAQNGEYKVDETGVFETSAVPETPVKEEENVTPPTASVPVSERLRMWFQNRPASVDSVDMDNPLSRLTEEEKPKKEEDAAAPENGEDLLDIELKLVPTVSFLNRYELWNSPPFFLSVPPNTTVEHLSKLLVSLITPKLKPTDLPLQIPYFWLHDRIEGSARAQYLYMHELIGEIVKSVGSVDKSMTLSFDVEVSNDRQSRLDNFVSLDYIDDLPNMAANASQADGARLPGGPQSAY